MNSTPPRPTSTMRLTALLPPPPTPITLIFAPRLASGSSVSLSLSVSIISASVSAPNCQLPTPNESCEPPPWELEVGRRGFLVCKSKKLFEDAAEPSGHPAERPGAGTRRLRCAIAMRVQHDADRRRERRAVHMVGKAADTDRTSAADRKVENLFGDFRHPFENRAAAGQHDAGVQRFLVAGATDLVPDQVKRFLGARLQDLGQNPARHQ